MIKKLIRKLFGQSTADDATSEAPPPRRRQTRSANAAANARDDAAGNDADAETAQADDAAHADNAARLARATGTHAASGSAEVSAATGATRPARTPRTPRHASASETTAPGAHASETRTAAASETRARRTAARKEAASKAHPHGTAARESAAPEAAAPEIAAREAPARETAEPRTRARKPTAREEAAANEAAPSAKPRHSNAPNTPNARRAASNARPDAAPRARATPHSAPVAEPVVLPASVHGIDPALISRNAIRVTDGLQQAGFRAFIVGGAVRDLLLGVAPKDFDVATDATPDQVQKLFRRARLIGRRFQIVHVQFGQEIIEVSTFRALVDAPQDALPENSSADSPEDRPASGREARASHDVDHDTARAAALDAARGEALPASAGPFADTARVAPRAPSGDASSAQSTQSGHGAQPAEAAPAARPRRSRRDELDRRTHAVDASGRVLRDNVWGEQHEDATRRDFTINAMYYDPATQTVLDYHDGLADVRARLLRMIGDPATRYREDPVRMLRVVRFAAKLDFEIEERTRAPIGELAGLIEDVPAARLFDEMLKLLLSGHALACLKRLRGEGLHHGLLPLLDAVLEQPHGERFVTLALAGTDARVRAGKPVSPGFLFAALLWHDVQQRAQQYAAAGEHPTPALSRAMDDVLDVQTRTLAIQRRYSSDMRELWGLQARLEKRAGRSALKLLEHPRFRAGYDFLLLRCESGELDATTGQWWTDFIDGDMAAREALLAAAAGKPGSGERTSRRRRRRGGAKNRRTNDAHGADGASGTDGIDSPGDADGANDANGAEEHKVR